MSSPNSIPITILGGGIAGLTAAVHLRQSGFDVTVYEQSSLAREIGAAFSVSPNATAILTKLGIDPHDGGAVDYEAIVWRAENGTLPQITLKPQVLRDLPKSEPWVLAHRFQLHKQLRTAAEAKGVKLVTSKRVDRVDLDTMELFFHDGTSEKALCILGADGVHSKTRYAMYPEIDPKPTAWAAYRFLLNREEAESKTDMVDKGILGAGTISVWGKPELMIVVYPTSNDTQLNFVCLFPTRLMDGDVEHDSQYSQKASKEEMLKIYDNFDPSIRALMKLADPDHLRYWPLMDMDNLPSYVHGNAALLGDSAHPFLPFAYQGACLAIEDGAAMGVLLAGVKDASEIKARLELYEELRHKRCDQEQQFSRDLFKDHSRDLAWDPAQAFQNIYLYRVEAEAQKLKAKHGLA